MEICSSSVLEAGRMKSSYWQGITLSWDFRGNSVFCLLQLVFALLQSLPSFFFFFNMALSSAVLLFFCLSQIYFCLPLLRTYIIGFRVHPDNPGWYLHLKTLNYYYLQRPFSQKTISQVIGTRMWTYLWQLPFHLIHRYHK